VHKRLEADKAIQEKIPEKLSKKKYQEITCSGRIFISSAAAKFIYNMEK
jgi:hypothetical protein